MAEVKQAELAKDGWIVEPNKHWKRISNGDILSSEQINLLLEVAPPMLQALLLLDIYQTDEAITVTSF